jgi:hypothetical protein
MSIEVAPAKSRSPILIIGYNRLDLLKQILKETQHWDSAHTYISIDGPINEAGNGINQEIRYFLETYADNKKVTVWFNEENLGNSKNLVYSITRVFEMEETCIVIEDDIQICYNAYEGIDNVLRNTDIKNLGIVGGFSALPAPPKIFQSFLKNKFRPCIRVNIWGWGVRKSSWKLYERDLSSCNIENVLDTSKSWLNLSHKQQQVWRGRFAKVSANPNLTWDTQVQFMVFRYDLINFLPRFRTLDNVGFSDLRSTNNKSRKSRLYLGKTDFRKITDFEKNIFVIKVLNQIELSSDTRKSISQFIRKLLSSFWYEK